MKIASRSRLRQTYGQADAESSLADHAQRELCAKKDLSVKDLKDPSIVLSAEVSLPDPADQDGGGGVDRKENHTDSRET